MHRCGHSGAPPLWPLLAAWSRGARVTPTLQLSGEWLKGIFENMDW